MKPYSTVVSSVFTQWQTSQKTTTQRSVTTERHQQPGGEQAVQNSEHANFNCTTAVTIFFRITAQPKRQIQVFHTHIQYVAGIYALFT